MANEWNDMVTGAMTDVRAAERALAVSYAPPSARPALVALLALDRRLGDLVAGSREPLIAQMRLTWWHAALRGLDDAPPPAEPVLAALAGDVVPAGVAGTALAAMVEGWEVLLDTPLDAAALDRHAHGRGARLFEAGAVLLGGDGPTVAQAGEGWALADLAARIGDPTLAVGAATAARDRLDSAFAVRWPRRLRALGALVLLARADLDGIAPGSPRRVARLLRHRLTGR